MLRQAAKYESLLLKTNIVPESYFPPVQACQKIVEKMGTDETGLEELEIVQNIHGKLLLVRKVESRHEFTWAGRQLVLFLRTQNFSYNVFVVNACGFVTSVNASSLIVANNRCWQT